MEQLIQKKTNVLEDNSQTSYAKDKTPSVDNTLKIYDYAKLIPDDKEKEIYNMIKKFISKYNMDMAIVTINENPKSSSMGYADDFYDYNDFGVGVNKNGLLFLIDMDNRKMWISTTGKAIEIYNDKRIDAILDYTYDKISKKDYSGCAEQFIKYATYFAKKGRNGGHTELIEMTDHYKFKKLGGTLDDAIGECYDKVARVMNLEYPGGPKLDKLSKEGKNHTYPYNIGKEFLLYN